MSVQFVKSAVLSSENGIDFSKEEIIENAETTQTRFAQQQKQGTRSLFEQLNEQQEKKQAEYDANTKLLFAPPKALDEEEFSFLQNVQESRQRSQLESKLKEEKALEEFRTMRRLENSIDNQPKLTIVPTMPSSKTVSILPKINATKVKRKANTESSADDNNKQKKMNHDIASDPTPTEIITVDKAQETLSLLCSYGSDDDNDN